MRAGSSITSLATGLVTSAVETRNRVAQATPSLPEISSVTTLKEHRVQGHCLLISRRGRQFRPLCAARPFSAPAVPALWGVPIPMLIFDLPEIRIRPASQQLERTEGDEFVSCFFHECQGPGVEASVDLTQEDEALPIVFHPWRSWWDKLPLDSLSNQISQDLVSVDLQQRQFLTKCRQRALIRNSLSMSLYLSGWKKSTVVCASTETSSASWGFLSSLGGSKELRSDELRL
ncbi:hypothetical protein T07_2612 [Trichinella nelsoni]|uniref:Uncharacterized protein n=1 Tax=Trichinella nelsoni TaxID=6336 RepID=A0A0V0RW98_9BILA|nr:hypothetical protein T07_2612 [Trichinella nelsoni]